jgi:twitching motility protein PilT
MLEIEQLFRTCIEKNASDLHIVVGRPPVLRIGVTLENIETRDLQAADVERLIYALLNDEQKNLLLKQRELDFAISIPGVSRFRGNAHFQRGTLAAAFRALPLTIPSMEELRLPADVLTQLARRKSGLVLVTGPTGAGKSTTMASVIDLINSERKCHVITIEDPLEYLHSHNMAIIEQRELHEDTLSYPSALKHVLRQDPDVIQTVDRIINVFPSHQQDQARVQLAGALEGIISQRLIPQANENRLTLACEVMVATDAIRSLIREGKTHMIPSTIESSSKHGMINMDRALVNLFKNGMISKESVIRNCIKPDYIKGLLNS